MQKSNSSTAGCRSLKKGEKLSGMQLIYISEQAPLDVFLQVYQPYAGFFECFEEKVPDDYIRPMIVVLAKLCGLPFQEYAKNLLAKFLNSASMLLQIKDFLTGENATTDIIDKFLSVSWRIQRFGLKNEELFNLLDCIKLKYESNFAIKAELHSLLDAIRGSFESYKEIYPSLDDLKNNEPVDVKPNIVKGKYSSVQEYISTHLSLLREDFIAPLRELIIDLKKFESVEEVPSKHIYKQTRFLLNDVMKTRTPKGVNLLVDLQPSEREIEGASRDENRKPPWVNPKKLTYGTLLCFTSGLEFSDMILAVVAHREIEMLANGYVYVEILRMYNVNNIFNRDFLMLESEVYFEAYHHVYGVLRGLHEQNFPMKNYIVNLEQNSVPPDYLKGSYKFNYIYGNKIFNPRDLGSYPRADFINLDRSQLAAYQSALSSKFSLIQGPPGTGKTFIGLRIVSTLLKNIDARILIVCHTNHALDEFLSGILANRDDIVWLGNQSKHELLDEYSTKITEGAVKSRYLNFCFNNAELEYTKQMKEFERLQAESGVVCYGNVLGTQSRHLASTSNIFCFGNLSKHKLFDEQITEGAVKSRNLNVCFNNAKLEYSKLMEEFERLQTECGVDSYEKVLQTQKKLQKVSAKLDELKQIFEFKLVKSKRVVGMTATYASRSNLLLQLLKIPIVIVEEAAEVLEPHIVAALTQSTQHLILIGDHQQLRPTTSVYRLSEKYKMDISLFERLINNNLNCVCLNTQHRMRSEFANLIRPTIYKDLLDAENVQTYENIRGVAKNMFFLNHEFKETKSSDETTKRNPYEVGFLLALADYLITQNYQPKDIVILATYNGQMLEFFNERKKYPRLEKVRITVVDNFQGEESKIILLSLVRNNDENRIGSLALKNRICVALSRAQEGFFVCGAINFLARNNSTWEEVKKTLEEQNSIGNSMPIVCQHHGNVVEVRNVEDFNNLQSGRCCNF